MFPVLINNTNKLYLIHNPSTCPINTFMALRIEEVHKDKYVTNKESYLIFHLFFTNVCVLILFIDNFQKSNERAQPGSKIQFDGRRPVSGNDSLAPRGPQRVILVAAGISNPSSGTDMSKWINITGHYTGVGVILSRQGVDRIGV